MINDIIRTVLIETTNHLRQVSGNVFSQRLYRRILDHIFSFQALNRQRSKWYSRPTTK